MLSGILFLSTAIFVLMATFFATMKPPTSKNNTKILMFLVLACASFVTLLVSEFGLVGVK